MLDIERYRTDITFIVNKGDCFDDPTLIKDTSKWSLIHDMSFCENKFILHKN